MKYSIEQVKDVLIVKADDFTQETENKALAKTVKTQLVEQKLNLVAVDLSEILYVNSVGLNFLISMLTSTRKLNGDAILIKPNKTIENLLEVTKLKPLFRIAPTAEDAVSALHLIRQAGE